MSSASPTSVTDNAVAASSPTKEKKQSMVKRLAGGSFSPSKKSSSQNLEESLEDTAAAAKTPEVFVNSDEEATDDDENVDLSVVRSLLGSSFKLDKDTDDKNKKGASGRAVSFSGVDSPASSKGDETKSTGELLAKITRLELKLKQAELDCSAEKARRKKSSRSTIKLAKEINKRTVEAAAQQKAIATLTTANATLDTKLTATRKELDERITASEISNRDHHMHLSESQQKYRDTCDENDRRMAEMTKLHNDEVENLRKQLTTQNRDLDMLRGKLVSLEVKEAERIAEHTVYTGIDPTEARSRTWKKQKKNIAIGVVALAVGWFYQRTEFSMDAVCGPTMPGTTLSKASSFEAPWFAPGPLKQTAFGVCGGRDRVSIKYAPKGGGDLGRITVETLDEKKPKTLFERNALSAVVKFDRLDIMEKKGKLESVKLPWAA